MSKEIEIYERIDQSTEALAEDFVFPELFISNFPLDLSSKELASWLFKKTNGVFGGEDSHRNPKLIDYANQKVKAKIFVFKEIVAVDDHIVASPQEPEFCLGKKEIEACINYLIENNFIYIDENGKCLLVEPSFSDKLWYEN